MRWHDSIREAHSPKDASERTTGNGVLQENEVVSYCQWYLNCDWVELEHFGKWGGLPSIRVQRWDLLICNSFVELVRYESLTVGSCGDG